MEAGRGPMKNVTWVVPTHLRSQPGSEVSVMSPLASPAVLVLGSPGHCVSINRCFGVCCRLQIH